MIPQLPFHQYPYTDFHELNLDYILKLARESLGIHLEVVGDKLQLKNAAGDVISNVQISYAQVAAETESGKAIDAFIYDAGLSGRAIVFTKGNNDTTVVQFPNDAVTDVNGKNLTSYIAKVDVAGTKLRVTDGTGAAYTFTCPYANAAGTAATDENGKSLTTYMASVTVVDNKLVFRDGDNVILAEITVPYATSAGQSEVAVKDVSGNNFISDYAESLVVDGNQVGLQAHDGTGLGKITVPFASVATNATNAIQQVTISGDNLIFTTYGGQIYSVQSPMAVKAQKDDLGNVIKSSYVANVTANSVTGEISFLDALGHEIVSITPTVDSAVHDSLGNNIFDYVKTIVASPNSDYVQVTEGDGSSYTLTINYSNKAWKDTYGNIIGNTFCSLLTMGVDPQDGEPVVIGWNGETPKAEIFRLKVVAVSAQKDQLGNVIDTFYGHSLQYTSSGDRIDLLDASGNSISHISIDDATGSVVDNIVENASTGKVSSMDIDGTTYDFIDDAATTLDDLTDVTISNPADGDVLVYDDQTDEWVNGVLAVPDELSDLSDVDTTGVADGDVLTYNTTDQEWQPKAPFTTNGGYLIEVSLSLSTTIAEYLILLGTAYNFTSSAVTVKKLVDGSVVSGAHSIDYMIKDGPVYVKVINSKNSDVIYYGAINDRDANNYYSYGMSPNFKMPVAPASGSLSVQSAVGYAKFSINNLATSGSFSLSSSQLMSDYQSWPSDLSAPIFVAKSYVTHDPAITDCSMNLHGQTNQNLSAQSLVLKLMAGCPLPMLHFVSYSDDGETPVSSVETVRCIPDEMKVFKHGETDKMCLIKSFSNLLTLLKANTTDGYDIHFIYKNIEETDGTYNTYDIYMQNIKNANITNGNSKFSITAGIQIQKL